MGFELSAQAGFRRNVKDMAGTVERLSGDTDGIAFDPKDPASVERAVEQMRTVVDAKAGGGPSPARKDIIEAVKTVFETAIRENNLGAKA